MSLFFRSLAVILFALPALLWVACSPTSQPPLRVATNVWSGYETLYLARSLGLYDPAHIRLVEMTSAGEVSYALRNSTVEAGALTLDEALSLMQDGMDLRVVLVMDVSHGADALLARDDIEQLQDLRGKRVGVETGAVGAMMLDAALQAGRLRATDIKMVPLPPNALLAAWRDGRVDAVVTFNPLRTQLLAQGAHSLFDSSQIPGRIIDVLVVRGDVFDSRPGVLKELLLGYFAALAHLQQNPQDAATRMAPRLGVTPEQVPLQFSGLELPGLQENRNWLSGPAPAIKAVAADLGSVMLQRHLLRHPVNIDRLAAPDFLPEAPQ